MLDALFSYRPPSSSGERKNKNEVDYNKNPTKLFKRVEARDWESSVERIRTNPVEAKISVYKNSYDGSVKWKRLPLHEACMRNPTPMMLESLLHAYLPAAMTSDGDGRLPLHHVCANGASLDVFEQLLVAYPEAMERQDSWKKTPLQTLMSQYFPDPHCISALKRGVAYYKTHGVNPPSVPVASPRPMSTAMSGSTAPPFIRSEPSYSSSSPSFHPPMNQDRRMVDGLQGEIGRYSEKIAVNMDKEKTMYKRIRMLEGEVNRLLSKENDNIRLQTELRNLENELRSTNDELDGERAEGTHTLQMLEDSQRSEERLKQELEDTINDPRQRILEDKVNEITLELHEKDNRFEKDAQNLRHALQNAERNANHAGSDASKFEHEYNKMQLEMQKLQYEKKSGEDNIQDLKQKLSNMDIMSRDMDVMVKEQRRKEDQIRDFSHTLQQLKEENARLCADQNDLTRIKDEFHNQANYVYDMEEKLRHSEDEIARFKDEVVTLTHAGREERDFSQRLQDEVHAMEREIEEVKLNEDNNKKFKEEKEVIRSERNDLQKTVDDLEGELRVAEKSNADLVKEIDIVRKQCDEGRQVSAETKKEMNEHKKREIKISLEVHKLEVSMRDKIGEFKQKWQDERSKCLQLSTRCEGLEAELSKKQEQTFKAESASNEATRFLSDIQNKAKDQELVIKALSSKGENLDSEMTKMRFKLVNWEVEKESLVKSKESALSQQQVMQERIISLEAMLAKPIQVVVAPIDLERKEKQLLEEECRTKFVEIESLKEEVSHLNKRLEELKFDTDKQKKSYEEQMFALVTQRDDLLDKASGLEYMNTSLLKTIEKDKGEVTALRDTFNREKTMLVLEHAQRAQKIESIETTTSTSKLLALANAKHEKAIFAISIMKEEIKHLQADNNNSAAEKIKNLQLGEHENLHSVLNSMQDEIDCLKTEKTHVVEKTKKLELQKRYLERSSAHIQDQLIVTMKERDTANRDLIECKRTLDQTHVDDKSSQTPKENDIGIGQLRKEGTLKMTKIYALERENTLLRAMLEEPDDQSSDSLNNIEERLFDLEQRKDAEIAVLIEERNDFVLEISRLKDRHILLVNEVKRFQNEQIGRSTTIEMLRQKRDRKKKTIQERLKDYEIRSCAGSVVSIEKMNARMEKDEASSFISGLSYDLPTSIGEDRGKWPVKYNSAEQKRRSFHGASSIYEQRVESRLPSMLYIDERDDDFQSLRRSIENGRSIADEIN